MNAKHDGTIQQGGCDSFKFIIIYLNSNNIYIGTLFRPSPSEISKIEKSMKIIYTNKLITM